MESGTGSFTPAPVMVHPLTVFLGGQNVVPRAGTAASSEDASAHSSISLPFDSDSSDDDDSSFVDGIYVGSASTRRLSAAAGPLTLRAQANRRAKVSSDSKKRLAPKHLTPSSLKRHAGQRRSRRYMNGACTALAPDVSQSLRLPVPYEESDVPCHAWCLFGRASRAFVFHVYICTVCVARALLTLALECFTALRRVTWFALPVRSRRSAPEYI